jgi:hypothetical protein
MFYNLCSAASRAPYTSGVRPFLACPQGGDFRRSDRVCTLTSLPVAPVVYTNPQEESMSKRNIVHVEFSSRDFDESCNFYEQLFGWKIERLPEMN